MFERFTDRARRVVVLAQEEAKLLKHNYIGTEHILLGLIHEGEGIAAKALEGMDISLEQVRDQVTEIIGEGQQAPSGHIPFTPRAKKVLELSLREALQLGHTYIGTEHILLGLIREGEGVAAQVLVKLGADLPRVRQEVIKLISGYQGKEPATAGAGGREGFIEVETPMLQVIPSGAAARPFKTHINAYDMELFLRIAPELFLKKAVVGGLDKIFEINRNFRNEGVDATHSPEFAMLEFYEAYGDFKSAAALTKKLIQNAAIDATGSTTVTLYDGTEYDLGGEWPWISMYESLAAESGEDITPETPIEELVRIADKHNVDMEGVFKSHGKYVEELWEHFHEGKLDGPIFVTDFPVDTSPLVREHPEKKGVVEKWDLYVRGFELATGYSELVDPVIQRERFEAQAKDAAKGDDEAMPLDEEFLRAMEHGMPPTGGVGIGIDRLLMALTGLGIRETVLFPFVKPLDY